MATRDQGFDAELLGMGDKGVLKVLNGLAENVRKKIMGKASMDAMKPVLKSAQAAVLRNSDRTGMLHLTLKRKKKQYADGTVTWVGIGPQEGVAINHPVFGRVEPAKYAHLVEFGFIHRNGGVGTARPFLRPALDANFRGMKESMARDTRKGIARYLNRVVKKHAL